MEKTTLLILAIALTCLIVDESLGIATSLHGTRIRALPTEKSYKRRLKNRIAAWTANQWTGARRVRRIRRRKGKSKVSKKQLKISFSSIFFVVVQFNLLVLNSNHLNRSLRVAFRLWTGKKIQEEIATVSSQTNSSMFKLVITFKTCPASLRRS